MNRFLWSLMIIMTISVYAQAGGTSLIDSAGSEKVVANGHSSAPEEMNNRENPIIKETGSINRGRDLFLRNCASCHGENADGNGPAAKSLTPKPANLKKMSGMHPDGDLAWTIKNGKGTMPAWKNILNESQIWDAVNYIQSLSGPNKDKHDNSH